LWAVSSTIRKISQYAVGRTVGAVERLLGIIAKRRKALQIPTGYQNETGFHFTSHLPKEEFTGRRFNEGRRVNVDAGSQPDMPAMSSIGFFDHES
jgi:hypothetical protein